MRGEKSKKSRVRIQEPVLDESSPERLSRSKRRDGPNELKTQHRGRAHRHGENVHDEDREVSSGSSHDDSQNRTRSRRKVSKSRRRHRRRSSEHDASNGDSDTPARRRTLPTLKLGTYDGSSCLETFFGKIF